MSRFAFKCQGYPLAEEEVTHAPTNSMYASDAIYMKRTGEEGGHSKHYEMTLFSFLLAENLNRVSDYYDVRPVIVKEN